MDNIPHQEELVMRKRLSLVAALAAILSVGAVGTAAAGTRPVELTFEKQVVAAGTWVGTVGGDSTGTIDTVLTAVEETGSIWHVTFNWQVTLTDGGIAAEVNGIINLRTGRVVMNGEVLRGYLAGSRIHVEALLDLNDMSSQGTMHITP